MSALAISQQAKSLPSNVSFPALDLSSILIRVAGLVVKPGLNLRLTVSHVFFQPGHCCGWLSANNISFCVTLDTWSLSLSLSLRYICHGRVALQRWSTGKTWWVVLALPWPSGILSRPEKSSCPPALRCFPPTQHQPQLLPSAHSPKLPSSAASSACHLLVLKSTLISFALSLCVTVLTFQVTVTPDHRNPLSLKSNCLWYLSSSPAYILLITQFLRELFFSHYPSIIDFFPLRLVLSNIPTARHLSSTSRHPWIQTNNQKNGLSWCSNH